jgi:hypothetical protein
MIKNVLIAVVAGTGLWLGLLDVASAASTPNQTWNGFTYTVTSNEVTILAWQSSATALEIPAEIDGKPVRSIGQKAFSQKRELKNVSMPDSVRQIGVLAFELCISLTNVALGKAVDRLGDGAFAGCYVLRDVQLPEGLASVGSGAFQDCRGLSRVVLPASLRTLGDGVFTGCAGLKTVALAEGNESFSMREGVLFNRDLTTLFRYPAAQTYSDYIIPASVTRIAGNAFESSRALRSVTIPPTVTNIGAGAFLYCEKLGSITLPEGVTSIASKSFDECRSLTNVTFGSRVTNICSEAFFRCASLKRVVIPDSVSVLGDSAFSECGSLEDVTLGAGLERLGTWVFGSGRALKQIRLPDRLRRIGSHAFTGCGITNLVIGPQVNELDIYTLGGIANYVIAEDNQTYLLRQGVLFSRDMTTLLRYPPLRENTEYRVPDGVTTVGANAFAGVTTLTRLVLAATVTNIGAGAFQRSALRQVAIPAGIRLIGRQAFGSCAQLEAVLFEGDMPPLNADILANTSATVCYREGAQGWTNETAYGRPAWGTSTDGRFLFAVQNRQTVAIRRYLGTPSAVRVPDMLAGLPVTAIGAQAFASNTILTSVTIPASVTGLARRAFASCASLESVVFEGHAPYVEADVFANTPASIYHRSGAQGWDSSFAGRPALACSFDNGLAFMPEADGSLALVHCFTTNRSVTVPAEMAGKPVGVIGPQAFAGGRELIAVTIPASVRRIGARAFDGCYRLTSVAGATHVPAVGPAAFACCYSLTNAVLAGPRPGDAEPTVDAAAGRMSLHLRMANGDTLTGITTLRALPLRMADALLSVPLAHIAAITRGAGGAAYAIRLRKGDLLEGEIELKQVEITGLFGKVAVDVRQIAELEVAPAVSARVP